MLDSFTDAGGAPVDGLPTMRIVFAFEPTASGTELTNTSYFTSAEALEQVVAMGVDEGSTLALDQMDGVLKSLASTRRARAPRPRSSTTRTCASRGSSRARATWCGARTTSPSS